MDVICGRKTVGRTTGELLANGRPISKSSWSRVVSGGSCEWGSHTGRAAKTTRTGPTAVRLAQEVADTPACGPACLRAWPSANGSERQPRPASAGRVESSLNHA